MALSNYPVWPISANWKDDITESYEWLTEVLRSTNGAEQRRSLRPYPRTYLEFSVTPYGADRQAFDNFMFKNRGNAVYLPYWPHRNVLAADLAGGDTQVTLKLPIDNQEFTPGLGLAFVGRGAFTTELCEIASVSGDTVTLLSGPINNWPAGSTVYPARAARLTEIPSITRLNDSAGSTTLKFQTLLSHTRSMIVQDTSAGPLIVDGLISNSYHQETGRGGYFHTNSGTSEGQSIMIHALLTAYGLLESGTIEEQLVADYYLDLAYQMLDALGDGSSTGPMLRQEIPTDPNTITMLHWLVAARGDVPQRDIVYDLEITKTGNKLVIQTNAHGADVYTVWKIYPADSRLLYDSPYSPAFHVNDDGQLEGPDTSITIDDTYASWHNSGLTSIVVLPDSAPDDVQQWKVVYGYNTSGVIPIRSAQEAYPSWTMIPPGYVACAPDTFRWFDQAIGLAIQYDTREGKSADWTNLRAAMRRSAVRGQSITDLRTVLEPMIGFDAIPASGSPTGMYCYSDHPNALPPTNGALDRNWTGFDFWSRDATGDLIATVPDPGDDSLIPQVQIGRGFEDSWRDEKPYQDPDQYLYIAVSASKVPSSENEGFYVYVGTTMSYDETQRWYADLSNYSDFVAKNDGTVCELFVPRSAFRTRTHTDDGKAVWGSEPFDVGTTFQNFGISIEMKGGYSVILRKLRLVSGPTQAWVDDNKAEAIQGTDMPFFPGSLPFATNADIPRQTFVGWNGSPFHGYQLADFWYQLGDDADYVHPTLTADQLPIPNATTGAREYPMTATNSNGTTKPRNALLMEQQLRFLLAAQNKYKADAGDSVPIGPFAHTFVLNTPARSSLGDPEPDPHTWVYVNDDPNTQWIGYQCRVVESLANLTWITTGDTEFQTARSLAWNMVLDWLRFLNTAWPDLNGTIVNGTRIYGSPTYYPDPRISAPYADYEEPHGPALVLRACVWLKLSNLGQTSLLDALILRCWNYMEMNWRTTGEMAYTWSPAPELKQWYGFWHGEIILTLCAMIDNPSALPSGIDVAVVRDHLVKTQTFLENYGVRKRSGVTVSSLPLTYGGYSVWTFEPNETGDLSIQNEDLQVTFDADTASTVFQSIGEQTYVTQAHEWHAKAISGHAEILSVLYDLRGKAVPVWLPTFMSDLTLTGVIPKDTAIMQVSLCGYTANGGPAPGREYVYIVLHDGTMLCRKVLASDYSGSNEVLTLDTIIRQEIRPADVRRISFMEISRLDTDTVDVVHKADATEGASVIRLTFKTAPDIRIPDAAFYDTAT